MIFYTVLLIFYYLVVSGHITIEVEKTPAYHHIVTQAMILTLLGLKDIHHFLMHNVQ